MRKPKPFSSAQAWVLNRIRNTGQFVTDSRRYRRTLQVLAERGAIEVETEVRYVPVTYYIARPGPQFPFPTEEEG